MPRRGDNLPRFLAQQLDFAAHIRHPELYPPPADVEPRRMRIYVELVYNNVHSFLSSAFPVARSLLAGERWEALVRGFVHRHPSESPYFLEISQEFLTFLAEARPPGLPPFMLELCHYEWVELALSVAEDEFPEEGVEVNGDLLTGFPVVSPLIWKLAYRFPVHRIGPAFQPDEPAETPTQLVVYRRRDDEVRFMHVNALTMGLLDMLEAGNVSGGEALERLGEQVPGLDPAVVRREGHATLERLRRVEIIAGIKTESGEVGP